MAVTAAMSDATNAWSADDPWVEAALRDAEIGKQQLVYDSSNYVFITELMHPEHGAGRGVYKPEGGEQPLHDFPFGTLYRREVAAYEFSELLGWRLVPPTVERDGPHGTGSMQLFIDHDPSEHYFSHREQAELEQQLVRFAAFDLIVNNADRKGGHLLLDPEGRLWGIDHGLCFHQQFKVRTVIWDFSGRRLDGEAVADLRRIRNCLIERDETTLPLLSRITQREVQALIQRCEEFIDTPVLPEMFPYRCVPWPLI